jgi:hypothetical protein
MRRRARDPITRLQTAIECLPERTRRAMLDGVRANTIVVGAYTDGHGGICPMLAAHRNGGRTSFLSFARAWDTFARAETVRPATARELAVLEDLLVASLADDLESASDLAAAIAEHKASVARSRPKEIVVRRLRLNSPILAASRRRGRSPESIDRDPSGPTTSNRGQSTLTRPTTPSHPR